MTNLVKGEINFEAGGKTYTFKLGANAQVLIESKVGMPMSKYIKTRFKDLGAADVRLIFWAGLFRQHQLTEDEVGDLIDEVGSTRVAQIFLEAFQAASSKVTNGADTENPLKTAKARIGMHS